MADQILTPQRLINGDKDLQTIEDFIKKSKDETVTTRFGGQIMTLKGLEDEVKKSGGYFKRYATLAAANADIANIPLDAVVKVTSVADGGDYEKAAAEASTLTKSAYDPYQQAKNLVDAQDSLRVNKGKSYPLKPMVRDGIDNTSRTGSDLERFSNMLLDVKVFGAKKDKYYRISYGSNNSSGEGWYWNIEEHDIATYSTASTFNYVVEYTKDKQNQEQPKTTSGIHSLKVWSSDKSMLFVITVDADSSGSIAIGSTDTRQTYGYIVDPVNYYYDYPIKHPSLDVDVDTEKPRLWQGELYPFVASDYKGNTYTKDKPEEGRAPIFDSIVDAYIENADPNYRYSVNYYSNGNTAFASDGEGWQIQRRLIADYELETAPEPEKIIDFVDLGNQPVPRTGRVEKITLKSSRGFSELVTLYINTAKLRSYGSFINNALVDSSLYGWYITPTNYIYNNELSVVSKSGTGNYLKYTADDGLFSYRFLSGGYVYAYVFGPNGANSLPNFKSINKASGSNLASDAIPSINSFTTDWLPPLVFTVDNNKDPANPNRTGYTGGNHTLPTMSDGTELTTAENALYRIFIDGSPLDMSKDFSGFVESLEVKVVNKVMASNSFEQRRFALEQIFTLMFDGSAVSVHCKLKALEPVKMIQDNALQMTTTASNSTMLFLDGNTPTRVAFDTNGNSGTRADYPNAWAIIVKGKGNIQASWIDRSFGMGDSSNVQSTKPLIFLASKAYHCAYNNSNSPLSMSTDYDYQYRGGYVLQHDNADNNYDCVLQLDKLTAVKNGDNYY